MDIQQLHYFISVAEYLSFTQAANHHYVAQTAISYQIMALEQELGIKLFHRTKRSVILTPAGEVFYDEAKFLVAKSEQAIEKAIQTANGFEGTLRIGFLGPHEKNYLPKLIRDFRRQYPLINVSMTQNSVEKLRISLQQELQDIIFTLPYGNETLNGASWKVMRRIPICAIFYEGHPLAGSSKLSRSDLANEEFIFIDRRDGSYVFDAYVRDCLNSGFSPNIVALSRSLGTVSYMVEAEIGIALLPTCFENKNHNLYFVPLEGENEYVESVAVWMDKNRNPAVDLFVKSLLNIQTILQDSTSVD